MSETQLASNPVREALGTMRAELDGMIAREIDRLLGSSVGTGMAVFPEQHAAAPRHGRRVTLGAETVIRGEDRTSVADPPASRARVAFDDAERTTDAGSRLDALARHLEGRLKRPRGRAGEAKSAPLAGGGLGDSSFPVSAGS